MKECVEMIQSYQMSNLLLLWIMLVSPTQCFSNNFGTHSISLFLSLVAKGMLSNISKAFCHYARDEFSSAIRDWLFV